MVIKIQIQREWLVVFLKCHIGVVLHLQDSRPEVHEPAQVILYPAPGKSAKLLPELEVTHPHSAPCAGGCCGSVLGSCGALSSQDEPLLAGKSQLCMLHNTKIGDILGFQAEVFVVVAHVVVKHQVFMKRMK